MSKKSKNADISEAAKGVYEKALSKSWHQNELKIIKPPQEIKKNSRNIWFNPPYGQSVKTNIGRIYLKWIRRFASEKKRKLFNKNNIKDS